MLYRRFVSHFLAGTSIVALTVSSFFVTPTAATPKDETTKVEFERETALVEIVVPDRKAVEDLVVKGFDLTGYVSDRNGQLEVQAVVTEADIEMLKLKGYKVTVIQTGEEGKKLLRQQEQTDKQKRQLAQQADNVKVFRADYFKNHSGLFLYLEVKSSAGPNTTMTAEWIDGKGNKQTVTMTRKIDAGEYLYHYVLMDIESVPENVVITTNQGGKVETGLKEWIGDGTPAGDDYFSDFVDKYMTPTEVTERIEQLAEDFPELAEIVVLPEKTNGYRRKAQVTIGSVVNSAIVLTSKAWGHEGGNDITVDIKAPKSGDSALGVELEGSHLTVNLGNNSTSDAVVKAINDKAGNLVTAARYRNSNGTDIVQPQSDIKLTDNLKAPKEVSRDPFEVKAIRIGKVRDGSKPGVLGYSQEHAREWVTPLVSVETAERLLRNYHTDENTKKLVDNLDIFIVPSVNPDGGHYSFYDYNSQRRNLTNHCGPEASDPAYRNSWGVDLNRNYKIGTVWDGWIGGS